MDHFGGVLDPNCLKYCSILLKFAPEVVFKERKTVGKSFWKIKIFTETARYQSLNFFSVFVQVCWNRKHLILLRTKFGHRAIRISQNEGPILVSIFQEKYSYFLLHFGYFLLKTGVWSHVEGSESKFDISYLTNTIPGHVSVQKVLFQHFLVLWL